MNEFSLPVEPSKDELQAIFDMKYSVNGKLGWGPAMRKRQQYFTPDDWYESLVNKLVNEKTRWLDLGCGRNLLPSNPSLAKILSERCSTLVGVDVDATILENPYVHECFQGYLQEYQPKEIFNLITLRMVAEHIVDPEATLRAMAELTQSGSLVVVYTIFKWSPIPLVTYCTPFFIHNPIKKILWGTESKDTFPVAYKMNTRSELKVMFQDNNFQEELFFFLDDCRTFGKFRWSHWLELRIRKFCRSINLPYPEVNLLGVYRRI